ncbi:hypothetical protein ACFQE1_00350 [Halobium palmae]|uniref:Uncharacterized protein n=1 Tax=Halobium palmae TaxID=1776492 RepID=A0ABD5RUM7_9EURY
MSVQRPSLPDSDDDSLAGEQLAPRPAYTLFETIENSGVVCRNCFRLKSRATTTAEFYRSTGSNDSRQDRFCNHCGAGSGKDDAPVADNVDTTIRGRCIGTVDRIWGPHNITLPTRGEDISFSRLLDRFCDRLEELDVDVDRDAVFDSGLALKGVDRYRSRDRDCFVAAVWAGVDVDAESLADSDVASVGTDGLLRDSCEREDARTTITE